MLRLLGTRRNLSAAAASGGWPRFLLLDEPFGMLDSLKRYDLQDALPEVWKSNRKTVVMVTHDVDEALYLAARIVPMADGSAAGVGEIMDVSFGSQYYRQRAAIIDFLEHHSKQMARQA